MSYQDTSREAYENSTFRWTAIRLVLAHYQSLPPGEGATAEEMKKAIYPGSIEAYKKQNTLIPSITELSDRGFLHDSGIRRQSESDHPMIVWECTDLGRQMGLGDLYSTKNQEKSQREIADEELASELRFAGTHGKVGEILLAWMKKYGYHKACIELYKTSLHKSKGEIQKPLL